MDLKDPIPPDDFTAVQDDATITSEQQPPSYQASTSHPPLLNLSFTPLPPPQHPITFLMEGESRSPNFTVSIPQPGPDIGTSSTSTRTKLFGRDANQGSIPLATIDTESSLVYHHSHIHDARPGGVMYTLKRHSAPPSSSSSPTRSPDVGAGDAEWRYTIHAHGASGARLLEVITKPDILSAASTRLVFRRADDGELDALRLKTLKHRDKEGGLGMSVEYRGSKVGEMVLVGGRREKPVLRVDVLAGGVDPLLFVVLALIVDDRWMVPKRRFKREFGRGFAGVGKGPWSGLAGAAAIGG